METVALEWISSVEVEPRDVVKFVQQLNNVPENAVCEVGDIFSRRYRCVGNYDERRIRNEVHLSCEAVVAEFLCKKFGKQTQHITGGEVIRIRCKRVYPGVKPLGKVMSTSNQSVNVARSEEKTDDLRVVRNSQVDVSGSLAAVLPVDKVIALIDLLGDQVVDAQESYEIYADADVRTPQRMTILGLTKALSKLSTKDCVSRPRNTKVTVESLRYLLSKLIANNNIGAKRIPSATTVPFLSYTDFLACYVAFLASPHSST